MSESDETMQGQLPSEHRSHAVDLSPNVANTMLTQVMQSGNIAQNNFITTIKFADNDYLEGHRIIGHTESMGVREVSGAPIGGQAPPPPKPS